ncbi:RND efflux transporter, translocase subunit [Devosia sp. LC5]|nr:RND efflux transporter, translocase subunit [Devosia sp. LC5]
MLFAPLIGVAQLPKVMQGHADKKPSRISGWFRQSLAIAMQFRWATIAFTVALFAVALFGLICVVAALLPTGTPLGFVALLGVLALAGIIIRNAAILIGQINDNLRDG